MKDDLANGTDSEVDIAPAVKELEEATASKSASGNESAPGKRKKAATAPTLSLDQTATQRLQTAQIAGQNIFLVKITLNEGTSWASVRCFQILQALSLIGEVITSNPTQEDIEAERVGNEVYVVTATEHDPDTLRAPLATLEDVIDVVIEPYTPPEEPALGEVGNIMGSFFLNALSDATNSSFLPSPPAVMMDMAGAILDVALADIIQESDYALVVETSFRTEDRKIEGTLLIMPSPDLLRVLLEHVRNG